MFALAALLAVPASPAPGAAAPPGDEAIVVSGQRDTQKAVQNFVRSLTPTLWRGQISRFEHSVCPAAYGLARPQAEAVMARIRLVAASVGIPVEKPGCAPDVVLIATSDKTMLLEELWRQRGEYFGDMTHDDVRALERAPEPAAAWQLRGAPINASGMDLYWDDAKGTWVNNTVDASSRLADSARPQFDGAVVVVERKALVGLTITQLADYAAIRALTGADPAKLANSGAPSILHVLEVPIGGTAPVTMTKWDFAFLRGFYDVRRYLPTGAQRSAIANSMSKDLNSAQH